MGEGVLAMGMWANVGLLTLNLVTSYVSWKQDLTTMFLLVYQHSGMKSRSPRHMFSVMWSR